MSRLIFDANTLGGTTTLSSDDAAGNFTIAVPAATGTMSVKDASGDATFRNITLTGAVLAGAWNGSTITVPYGGTGATTLTGYVKGNGASAMTASATIPNTDITGLGTMSTQNATAVTITGGTIDGAPLGGTTPAAATVTTLRINSTLSLAGTTGTAAQVLTSNGASPPTWQSLAGAGTVTSVDVSGGTTGLTTSGGPITGSGTITLAGTLAAVNGGTGQSSYVVGDVLYASTTTALSKLAIGTTGQVLTVASGIPSWATSAAGDVAGPASATDNAITRFDLTTGKLIQNSLVTVADDGAITAPGVSSVIPFYYANQAAFPSATTYHGAVAHSHADGAMYFAHAGAWVRMLNDSGPLGTPSSGTVTNLTGTASININGTVGATTANTGAFTTLSTTGNVGIGTASPGAKLAVVGTGYSPAITLTDGATLNWDTSLGQVAQVTLGGNRTFAAPTNLVNGGFYSLLIIQDGTGSRTISWNAVFDFTGGTAPTLSTTAGSKDLIAWRSDGTNMLEVGRSLGVA